jgi:hypothetical protein
LGWKSPSSSLGVPFFLFFSVRPDLDASHVQSGMGGFAPSPPRFWFFSSVPRAGATVVYALRFARRHIMQRRRTISKVLISVATALCEPLPRLQPRDYQPMTWARLGRMTDAECRANFVFDKGQLCELYDQFARLPGARVHKKARALSRDRVPLHSAPPSS